jgi:hypothetical protein
MQTEKTISFRYGKWKSCHESWRASRPWKCMTVVPFEGIRCSRSEYRLTKQTPWPKSASELYRPRDRHLSAKEYRLTGLLIPSGMYLKQKNSCSSTALITSPGMKTVPSRLNYSLPCTVQKPGAWWFIATEIISAIFRLQCTCYSQRRRLMAFLICR